MNRPTLRIEVDALPVPDYLEEGGRCYILARLNAPDDEHATHQAVYVLCACPDACLMPCAKNDDCKTGKN